MPKPLSEDWITAQLALCEKATKGPWMQGWEGEQRPLARRSITSVSTGKAIILSGTDQHGYNPTGLQQEENGAFIIAARQGYPLVLKRLQHFRASYPLVVKMIRHLEKLTIQEAADASSE